MNSLITHCIYITGSLTAPVHHLIVIGLTIVYMYTKFHCTLITSNINPVFVVSPLTIVPDN